VLAFSERFVAGYFRVFGVAENLQGSVYSGTLALPTRSRWI